MSRRKRGEAEEGASGWARAAVSNVSKGLALTAVMWTAPAYAQGLDARTEQALRDLKANEPGIAEVQQAALAFFKLEPETVSSLRTRAAWKAVLPEINVRYRTGTTTADNQTFGLGTGTVEPQSRDDAKGDVSEVQLSGTWNLPRLLFNPEVLDVSSAAALQESVIKEITRLYYTRRRLQVDLLLDPPRDPATRIAKDLRIEELTATVDALTGGLLSRRARGGARGMDDRGMDGPLE